MRKRLEKQLEVKFMEEMRDEDKKETWRMFGRDVKKACITFAGVYPLFIVADYLMKHPEHINAAKEYIKYLFN